MRISGNIAYIDEDGFETPVLLKECVVVDGNGFYGKDPKPSKEVKTETPAIEQPVVKPQEEAIVETPEGDSVNVVLAYEAAEIKHLNTTTFDAYLVNDSNYFLYFTYLTRGDGEDGWRCRFAGVVEPNIQLFLGEVTREDLPLMDRVAIQYVAFKRDKEFKLKAPVAVEHSLDTTKFFKLHCFRENCYFDQPVIAIDIVKNDIPQRAMVIDSSRLEDAIKSKRNADHLKAQPVNKKQRPAIIEVDLHIHELLDSIAGLSNSDMLEVQLKEVRRVMDANQRHKGQRIVFIHGKGEGVLRRALLDELKRHYKHCDIQDASFREYGFGATQVTIR